jgi:uncharacterized protein YxjI
MAQADQIHGVDLTGDEYRVVQHLMRNKYKVYDGDGTEILRAKQKLLRMKEEFPFVSPDGERIFTIKAQSILDHAGDYTIFEAETDEPVAVLEKKWTLLKHVWKIRDPDDERLLARIESGSLVTELLRNINVIASLIPHSYDIEDADGDRIGSIDGQLSLKDTYDITIESSGDTPREALVASAIAIDALEGN